LLYFIEGSEDGDERYPRLLWITYALGNQAHFWKWSYNMMRSYTEEDLIAMKADLAETCLPNSVLGG